VIPCGPKVGDPREYGAYSLRVGMITTANAQSVPDTAIMKCSGHKSVQTLSRHMCHKDLFAFDPLARALWCQKLVSGGTGSRREPW
jgi:hypothetical protein